MKKFLYSLLLCTFYLTLFGQYEYTFPEYMERLQKDVPRKAIDWFNENAYSDTLGVSRQIFYFYRGISRHLDYALYKANTNILNKALSDFRQALDIPYDDRYAFNDRALLYIAGILTVQGHTNNIELASLIFHYYVDHAKQYDKNYPTALYWSLYLKYINKSTYALYYDRLVEMEKGEIYPGRIIFDYFTGRYKTIAEMIKNLDYPEDMVQNDYVNYRYNSDIFAIIKRTIPILEEDPDLSRYGAYQYLNFEEYPPKKRILYSRVSEKRNPRQTTVKTPPSTNKSGNNRQTSSSTNNNNNLYGSTNTTTILPRTQGKYPLTLLIETKSQYGNININVSGNSINTSKTSSFVVHLDKGQHKVVITFLGKQYTNNVNIYDGAYNLLSILVQDERVNFK